MRFPWSVTSIPLSSGPRGRVGSRGRSSPRASRGHYQPPGAPTIDAPAPLSRALEGARALLLDGGLASALAARGFSLDGPLWSARAADEAPGLLEEIHRTWAAAGVDVLETATYQMTDEGLAREGRDEAGIAAAWRAAVAAARTAARERETPPVVALSLGPWGVVRADGSEYRGDYALAGRELEAFHAARLARAPDLRTVAFETFPRLDEARAALRALAADPGREAWLSFTLDDRGRLPDGTDLETAARALDGARGLVAIGVNCVAPGRVAPALRELRRGTALPLVAYPNSGARDADGAWSREARDFDFRDGARAWREAGARIIGGCCGVGPAAITAIARGIR
ncbi:MAG: homocysteine S-methyltransferase [Planctomycetota bacterium]